MSKKKSNTDDKNITLEQYKVAVEMADRISSRRTSCNSFYSGIHAFLLTTLIAAYDSELITNNLFLIIPCFVGIFISLVWLKKLEYFRDLNTSKFKVIHTIEKTLPVKIFTDEWEDFNKENKRNLSTLEILLPKAIITLYGLFLLILLKPILMDCII